MNRNRVSYIVIAVCVVVVATATIFKPFGFGGWRAKKVVEVPPVSINTILSNKMSDLDQTKRFDREIETFMARWGLVGGSFALMKNDSLIYAKGYGYADKDRGVKCDVNHVFRIASVSKLITATAIMKLIEQERLTLSSKVYGEDGILNDSMFLDINDTRLKQITVEHLLRHTSGLATPAGDPAFAQYTVAQSLGKSMPITVDDLVSYSIRYRLNARPGEKYNYSNLGYILLGKIIENITNIEYERYIQDSILAPAGCYDMFIGRNFSENLAPNEVKYYEVKEAEKVEAYDGSGRMTLKSDGGNNVTVLSSAGGWVASATELLKFVAAIDGCSAKKDILKLETIKKMTYDSAVHKPIGWAAVHGAEWYRSGSMSGTSAFIKKQTDGYSWVFVSNSSAWIGFLLGDYISSSISSALSRVDSWPKRDMFETKPKLDSTVTKN